MLARVQHQQQPPAGQVIGQDVELRTRGLVDDPQGAGDRMAHERAVPQARQGTTHAPSQNRSASSRAASSATRVLPTPPTPVTVTMRPVPNNP